MAGDLPKEKATRRKRRVPGTDKPPRKVFSLRVEESIFKRMNKMLKAYNSSRNEYIEWLIELDLLYQERLNSLKARVPAPQPIKPNDD